MNTMIATVIAALACGYCGGWLHRASQMRRGVKRRLPPNGSALQQQPEAVWAKWDARVGKALKRGAHDHD